LEDRLTDLNWRRDELLESHFLTKREHQRKLADRQKTQNRKRQRGSSEQSMLLTGKKRKHLRYKQRKLQTLQLLLADTDTEFPVQQFPSELLIDAV